MFGVPSDDSGRGKDYCALRSRLSGQQATMHYLSHAEDRSSRRPWKVHRPLDPYRQARPAYPELISPADKKKTIHETTRNKNGTNPNHFAFASCGFVDRINRFADGKLRLISGHGTSHKGNSLVPFRRRGRSKLR